MKTKPSIKELSADLQYLIEKKVEAIASQDSTSKQKLTSLAWDLQQIIDDAKHNKDDFEKSGLSVNAIEAEGFLRCALNIERILKSHKLNN